MKFVENIAAKNTGSDANKQPPLLSSLFDKSRSPTLVASAEGNIIYSNAIFCDMVSLSTDELCSMKIHNLIKNNADHENQVKEAISNKTVLQALNTIIFARFEPSGKAVKLVLNTLDVEGELHFLIYIFENEYRYSDVGQSGVSLGIANSINDNLTEAIYRSTPNGQIVYANRRFVELFGYKDLEDLSVLNTEKLFARSISKTIIETKLSQFGELRNERVLFNTKSGSTFWGLMNTTVIIDDSDNPFYDGMITGVSQGATIEELLAEKNEQLEKTNAQLDRFLYSTSHDLRAPLTSIMGLVNLMKFEEQNEAMENYIKQVERSSAKLDNVIRDMLSFAKNTRQKTESKKINFESLVNDVLLKFQDFKEFEKLDFVININERLPFFGDFDRIENIIYHLIKNTILFSDLNKENPYVRSDVNVYGDKVIVEIVDNGIGISKKYIDNIFNMFYRGTERSSGSGLGLYIVKETLLRIDGKITVESEVGHGSIFHLEIPNGTKGRLKSKKMKLYGE